MDIAIIATHIDPGRRGRRTKGVLQPGIGPLIASYFSDFPRINLDVINQTVKDPDWEKSYDLIFFSGLHDGYDYTRQMSRYFRNRGAKTVYGGIMASTFLEFCSQDFDSIAIGDAEGIVPQLLDDFQNGILHDFYTAKPYDPDEIRTPALEKIVGTAPLPLILEATKGCPYTCRFCSLTGQGTRFEKRSVDTVISEIVEGMAKLRERARFGIQRETVVFLDNNLGGDPNHLWRLAEAIKPLGINWGGAMTLNILREKGMIEHLADSGNWMIFTGIEGLDDEELESMNKPQNKSADTLASMKSIIETCYMNGISFNSGIVLSPSSSGEYLMSLPRLISEIGLYLPSYISFEAPIPGTPYFKDMAEKGKILPNTYLQDINGYTLTTRHDDLTPERFISIYKNILRGTYTPQRLMAKLNHDLRLLKKTNLRKGLFITLMEGMYHIRKLSPVNKQRTYLAGTEPEPPEYKRIPFTSDDFIDEEHRRKILIPTRITDEKERYCPTG